MQRNNNGDTEHSTVIRVGETRWDYQRDGSLIKIYNESWLTHLAVQLQTSFKSC